MKKNLNFKLFSGIILFALVIQSCSNDDYNVDNSLINKEEDYIRQKTSEWEAKGKEVYIEQLSLEELNRVMRYNNLPEFSNQDISDAKYSLEQRSCGYSCSTWVALGDNDGSGTLGVGDVIDLRTELCRLGGSPPSCSTGSSDLGTCSGSGCPLSQFVDNSALSYLANGTEFFILDIDDLTAMQERILGIICCN
jgi:hypothetical protein